MQVVSSTLLKTFDRGTSILIGEAENIKTDASKIQKQLLYK